MLLRVLYLLGTAAFVTDGVPAAHRAKLDPFGAPSWLSSRPSPSGRSARWVLGRAPLYRTHDWLPLSVITTVGGGTMRLLRTRELPERTLPIVDAMSLSAVTVTGAQAALEPGARPWRSCCPPY